MRSVRSFGWRGRRPVGRHVLTVVALLVATFSFPCRAASAPKPDRRAFQLGGWASRSALWFNPFAPWSALKPAESADASLSRGGAVKAMGAPTKRTAPRRATEARPDADATSVTEEPS